MPNQLLPLLALGLGALAALGFAPLDLWPATLVATAGLIRIIVLARGWWQAALCGLGFGTALSAVSLNWIAQSFTYQAKMPAALGWVAVAGLSLFLALYVAVPAALAALARRPVARIMLFVALWLPAEWLRGVLLTGFAWNPLGIVWLAAPGVQQWAAEIGGIGLSALLLLAASGLVWLAIGPAMIHRLIGGGLVVAVALAGWAGETRVVQSGFLGPPMIVVQPGIGQDARYDPAAAERHLATYLSLTREALRRADNTQEADLPDVSIREANIQEAPEIDSPLRPSTSKVTGRLENNLAAGLGDKAGVVAQQAEASTRRRAGEIAPALVLWPEGAIDDLIERDPALRQRLAGTLRAGDVLASPNNVRDYLKLNFAHQQYESFVVLFVDAQNRVLACEEMFRGTLTQTAVYPREVVKRTLAVNAAAVILAHNHPSGLAEPSFADHTLTRSLANALSMVDVRVLDHLIVAGNTVLSYAERGLL